MEGLNQSGAQVAKWVTVAAYTLCLLSANAQEPALLPGDIPHPTRPSDLAGVSPTAAPVPSVQPLVGSTGAHFPSSASASGILAMLESSQQTNPVQAQDSVEMAVPHPTRPSEFAGVSTSDVPHPTRPSEFAGTNPSEVPHPTRPADLAGTNTEDVPHPTRPADLAGTNTEYVPHPTRLSDLTVVNTEGESIQGPTRTSQFDAVGTLDVPHPTRPSELAGTKHQGTPAPAMEPASATAPAQQPEGTPETLDVPHPTRPPLTVAAAGAAMATQLVSEAPRPAKITATRTGDSSWPSRYATVAPQGVAHATGASHAAAADSPALVPATGEAPAEEIPHPTRPALQEMIASALKAHTVPAPQPLVGTKPSSTAGSPAVAPAHSAIRAEGLPEWFQTNLRFMQQKQAQAASELSQRLAAGPRAAQSTPTTFEVPLIPVEPKSAAPLRSAATPVQTVAGGVIDDVPLTAVGSTAQLATPAVPAAGIGPTQGLAGQTRPLPTVATPAIHLPTLARSAVSAGPAAGPVATAMGTVSGVGPTAGPVTTPVGTVSSAGPTAGPVATPMGTVSSAGPSANPVTTAMGPVGSAGPTAGPIPARGATLKSAGPAAGPVDDLALAAKHDGGVAAFLAAPQRYLVASEEVGTTTSYP